MIWKLHCDLKRGEFQQMKREIMKVIGLYVEMSGLQDWYRKKEILER
jgi:septum formation topological specificity factor MinE